MDKKFVEGEVWINGHRQDVKLAPYVCEYGFWLQNQKGSFGGPHTEIDISPIELDSYVGDGLNKSLNITIAKKDLGHIDECNGYAAADVGSHRRKIRSLIMKVERGNELSKFSFEGETGLLEPSSVSGGITDDRRKAKGIYVFRIWFEVPDQDLTTYFKASQALQAMERFSDLHNA